jgi:hypothetical protein
MHLRLGPELFIRYPAAQKYTNRLHRRSRPRSPRSGAAASSGRPCGSVARRPARTRTGRGFPPFSYYSLSCRTARYIRAKVRMSESPQFALRKRTCRNCVSPLTVFWLYHLFLTEFLFRLGMRLAISDHLFPSSL